MAEKHVYRFGFDENGKNVTEVAGETVDKAKWITGGKGANLAEMANIGLPVPPGFSITCQTCVEYSGAGNVWPEGVLDEIDEYRKDLEKRMGKKLGDAEDPLLVSVRSGAPFSMPGMMDTVLNLGLNDDSVQGLIKQTDNPRFAYDSYRRFVQMFSDVVMGVSGQLFEDAINAKKAEKGVKLDTELDADDLKDLVATFKQIFADNVDVEKYPEVELDGKAVFPHDPILQLRLAEQAVFGSWNTERAILYRKQNKIPDELGTAVNVQVMAFGNKGNTSATGVAFTRNPADGTNERYGDFLVNAQGEDVVAGIRNTEPIADLPHVPGLEEAGKELFRVFEILEDHYADMMDLEFTIEQGKLWMLQTRVGKRTALSALRVAIQMVEEGRIDKKTAVSRVAPDQLDQLLHPQFDSKAKYDVVAKGMNASPGAAVGAVVFSSADAVAYQEAGKPCVLVRWETTPDDLAGMVAAEGILTSHGGKTSHAAVIARGMGAPCVCGCESLHIDVAKKEASIAGSDIVLKEGDIISIDGSTGNIILGAVDLVRPELAGDLGTILEWADEISNDESLGRVFQVRANADNPADAKLSREFGATGIGLDRTEHMFLGDRKQLIQSFILAEDQATKDEAIAKLYEAQIGDFYEMFKAMDGLPVIVRLLDPPLHEFLESPRELEVSLARAEAKGEDISEGKALLKKLDSYQEANPMLGLRGCRLGIVYPELNDMQTRAIATAMAQLKKEGLDPQPEIMIPLVSLETEIEQVRAQVEAQIKAVCEAEGVKLSIPVGTMIEIPRAAVIADEIAKHADFFSFGTNDLTQMGFGFSRDDVESAFVPQYLDRKILKSNPFETLDPGIAKLVKLGVEGGHEGNPGIVCGVCGETGGDPESIHMYYKLGLDYVSCSPYRVPIARLAAAQAKLD
ncbi:pyruvate, phosphate dikinase [Olegusella massiliensis]|uniref:pyruvate, phosphate dikinase n=1 Tax=Olegusella massiliensis TaxID=1776381 RepID=UPI0040557E87